MHNARNNDKIVLNIENKMLCDENNATKEKVQKITAKESELLELHKVEKPTVDTVQECSKVIEQDSGKLISEGDKRFSR